MGEYAWMARLYINIEIDILEVTERSERSPIKELSRYSLVLESA